MKMKMKTKNIVKTLRITALVLLIIGGLGMLYLWIFRGPERVAYEGQIIFVLYALYGCLTMLVFGIPAILLGISGLINVQKKNEDLQNALLEIARDTASSRKN